MVPFITAYLICQNRKELTGTTFSGLAWGLVLISLMDIAIFREGFNLTIPD
jgi:hypothetical protein